MRLLRRPAILFRERHGNGVKVELETTITTRLTYDEAQKILTILDQVTWTSLPGGYEAVVLELNDLLTDVGVDSNGPLEGVALENDGGQSG